MSKKVTLVRATRYNLKGFTYEADVEYTVTNSTAEVLATKLDEYDVPYFSISDASDEPQAEQEAAQEEKPKAPKKKQAAPRKRRKAANTPKQPRKIAEPPVTEDQGVETPTAVVRPSEDTDGDEDGEGVDI